MNETALYDNLVKVSTTEEFKWIMFKWYMQGLHDFNYWSLNERP
jgi:hypothetical protein